MTTIYGIISEADAVGETVQQCISAGFDSHDIDIIGPLSDNAWLECLLDLGLPTGRCDHYSQRIRRGGTLLCVEFSDHLEQARLRDLMEEGGAEDIACVVDQAAAPRSPPPRDPVALLYPFPDPLTRV